MHYRRYRLYGDPNKTLRVYGTGKKKHQLWPVYIDMLRRCRNQNDKAYKNYGGRGIKVCDKWSGENGFWSFVEDMGKRPEGKMDSGRPRYTLERIDVNGDYCPENCKWATWREQGANRRHSSTVFLWGEKYTLERACEIFGINYSGNKEGANAEDTLLYILKNHFYGRIRQ